ncbi:hypothetical protein EOPP23_07085 [Endozoicomonas sp. OPT23]|uniref:putative RNA methyltransferase n=1 Tax=Endozoicomonas sp. OPT23 TaxID=2072845 RepID=UPI00129B4929|nr:methyltransferase domain-containing protein [Endozoicomonas sp. OPT23]MRI32750.1 hypothetical protein [Endozoicomonas sp. OPT23]
MSLKFRCPVCHSQLSQPETPSQGVSCENNHQFDRAKQGYLNLLPGHKKKSKNPGDDKTMVQARTRFLDSDCYRPVAEALVNSIKSIADNDSPVILDAGSGEGYYTDLIKQALPTSDIAGLDISKPAVTASCKRNKSIDWLVASVNDIPLMDNKLDAIVSIFSRCDWQEFGRTLKQGGHVFVLAPGAEHLMALRQAIYEEVRPYPVDKLVTDLPKQFELAESKDVQGTMKLTSSEQILDLLAMTPHYWHVKPEQKQALEKLDNLECSFDMKLYIVRKVS